MKPNWTLRLGLAAGAMGVFLSFAPAVAEDRTPEAELDAFLREWSKRAESIRTLRLSFRQEKKLRILRRPRVSEGDLVYAHKALSVRVRGRDGELESELLLKDGELKIHYPRLKRLETLPVGAGAGPPAAGGKSAAGPAIPFFAGDPLELRKDYHLSLRRSGAPPAGEKEARRVLTMTPREASNPVKLLELEFADFEVRAYRQVETGGDEVRLEVLQAEVNGEAPAERFELKLPEGTVVVKPLG